MTAPVNEGKLKRSALFYPTNGIRPIVLSIGTHLVKTEDSHEDCNVYLVVDGGFSGTRVFRLQRDVEGLLEDL